MKITPDNIIHNYTYDDDGNLTTITAPGNSTFTFTYDAANRRVTRTAPNGTTATYSYDTINRLTGIQTTKGETTIDYVNYTQFDNVGNRLTKNTPQENWAFTYDDIYRLTNASPTGTIHQPENYTYDAVGNRTTSGNEQFPQTNETVQYSYDDENRLTGVTITQGTNVKQLAFAYDPFGRRIKKTVSPSGGGSGKETTNYVYDGQSIIMEYDQSGNITAKYTHGPNIDEPLAVQQGTNTYYYHADGLGSITALSNTSGSIVQTYTDDSFGNMTTTGSISQPFTYTGREYDSETRMYFYRARYYDPKVGRFVTKDPTGFDGGDVNLYGYVWNNATNWTDPWGLWGDDVHGAYSGEDHGWRSPYNPFSTWRHFRSMEDVQPELDKAISEGKGNYEDFKSLMHQGQDTFSHYDAGYRGGKVAICLMEMRLMIQERINKLVKKWKTGQKPRNRHGSKRKLI